MYSLSQTVFFLFFFCLLFLLLIFGETTVGIPILGLFVLLCVSSFRRLHFERLQEHLTPVSLFGAFCLISLLSLFHTISIPYTVGAAVFYLSSFVLFIFVLCRDREWLSNSILLFGSCLTAVMFSFLTVVYTLFPALSQFLPSATLLTAHFGHNQAAVLFLLLLPTAWKAAEVKKGKLEVGAVVLLIIGLVFSFARFAFLLGTVELCLLWLTTTEKKLQRFGSILVIGVIGIALLIVIFGVIPAASNISCASPYFHQQLCKPVSIELRPSYWKQGLLSWLDRPLFGWGGGTFALLSPRYQDVEGQYSGYVHNEFLQMFSEYGVLGGTLFLAFGVWLAQKAFYALRKPRVRSSFCLALGICAVILESLTDFGWHMISLWMFFLLMVGCWMVEERKTKVIKKMQLAFTLRRILGIEFFVSSALVILWSGLFVISSVFWNVGKRETSLRIFPFTYWRVEETLKSPETVSSATLTELFSLYQNHTKTWDVATLAKNVSPSQKADFIHNAIILDPTTKNRYWQYLQASYEGENWDQFEDAANMWGSKTLDGEIEGISYEENGRLTNLLIDVANRTVDIDHARALRLYTLAYQLQPVRFVTYDVQLLRKLDKFPIEETLPLLNRVEYEYCWPYEDDMFVSESHFLQLALAAGNRDQSQQLTINILKLVPYKKRVAEVIIKSWKPSLKHPSQEVSDQVLLSYADAIHEWEVIMGTRFDAATRHQISEKINSVMNKQVDSTQALSLKNVAAQLDDSVETK